MLLEWCWFRGWCASLLGMCLSRELRFLTQRIVSLTRSTEQLFEAMKVGEQQQERRESDKSEGKSGSAGP